MPNPYLTPETKMGMKRQYVGSKFFAIVFVGTLASSIFIWWNEYSTGGLYGGESVELSQFGNCFFLALGALLGMIGAIVPAIMFLSISGFYRATGLRIWIIFLIASGILSPLCAAFIFTVLSMTIFFTIPDDWFRALFDVSDAIAE